MQNLMDLRIRLFVAINRLPNVSNVANYNSLHSSIVESGDKFCCLFVLNVANLVIQLCQLFLLGADQPLASLAATLLDINQA
jgi:hypothetical protein